MTGALAHWMGGEDGSLHIEYGKQITFIFRLKPEQIAASMHVWKRSVVEQMLETLESDMQQAFDSLYEEWPED